MRLSLHTGVQRPQSGAHCAAQPSGECRAAPPVRQTALQPVVRLL